MAPFGARTAFEPIEYEEPALDPMAGRNQALLVSRVLIALWAIGVTVAAWVSRGAGSSGDVVTWVGRAGIAVVAVAVVVGWAWSDRRARNIHLLDGRLPTRVRCVTAWFLSMVWIVLVALVVVPAEPTEPFDIRPTIIVSVFVLAVSRPYALVRRIFLTLTRVPADALIATAAIIDVVSFGLLWWRLTDWPAEITTVNESSAGLLVGVGIAASLALVANLLTWRAVAAAGDAAEAMRLGALQTRHEHKVLRLRGIDPTDPDVWWALVQRRMARERAEDRTLRPPTAPDRLIEQVRTANAKAFVQLGEEGSTELIQRLRSQFAEVLRVPHDDRPGAPPLERRPRGASTADPVTSSSDSGAGIASLRRRLGIDVGTPEEQDEALQRLITQASLSEVEAALAERADTEDEDRVRMVPPRRYALEAARYLMMLGFVASAGLSLWLVSRTLGAPVQPSGLLGAETVDDIDVARRAMITAFSVSLAFVPLWAASLARDAQEAEVSGVRPRLLLGAAAANAVFAALAFAVDGGERGWISALVLVPPALSCVWSVVLVEPVHRWAALRPLKAAVWALALPGFLVLSTIGGLQREVGPSDSLSLLAFGATLVAILLCVIVVFAALDSAELEDAIRLSPALAVPADRARR